jgi:hypothetical protein
MIRREVRVADEPKLLILSLFLAARPWDDSLQ